MLVLTDSKETGWARLVRYKDVFLITLYGNKEDDERLKIKRDDTAFVLIDKKVRKVLEENQNKYFVLKWKA